MNRAYLTYWLTCFPVLHGKKVTLRTKEREDQAIFWAYDNDLELAILSSDKPTPVSMTAKARFEETIAQPRPSHRFVIEVDDKMIGVCDLMDFDQVARTCTLGIAIGERDYWGRGYRRDAVCTLADYGFRHQNMHRIWLGVLASMSVRSAPTRLAGSEGKCAGVVTSGSTALWATRA